MSDNKVTHIAFASSETLYTSTDGYIERMRSPSAKPEANTVITIMDSFLHDALDAFFIRSMDIVDLSPGMQRIVNIAVDTITKASQMVIRRSAKKLDLKQHKETAEYMELMRQYVDETWYVAFPVEDDFASKLRNVVQRIEDGERESALPELCDLLSRLTDIAIYQYFERPMQIIKLGPILQKLANVGIETTRKASLSVIKKVIPKLEGDQIHNAAKYMDDLLLMAEPKS